MHVEWITVDGSHRDEIGALWQRLGERAAPDYFLSWSWIEVWLQSLPAERDLRLGVIWQDDQLSGAFFLGRTADRRYRPLRTWNAHLNATGIYEIDELCVEYNSLLCPPPTLATPRFSLQSLLREIPAPWDELHLSALDAGCFPGNAVDDAGWPYRIDVFKRAPSYFVDLQKVRDAGDFLALLGTKTRAGLRRTYRAYQSDGPIVLEVGQDRASCLLIFDELVALHQAHWKGRGLPGAFASAYFRGFHRTLIERRCASGEIQLLRVRAGQRVVGCLYNFVYRGTVYHYQSGMSYEPDPKDRRPGFLCLAEAITHNAAAAQLGRFDFLAGTQDYKRKLSTGRRELVWARVEKPRLRFHLGRAARQLREQWQRRQAPQPSGSDEEQ